MAKKPKAPKKPKVKAETKTEPVESFELTDGSGPLIVKNGFLLNPWPGQIILENDLVKLSGDRFNLAAANGTATYRVVTQGKYNTHGEMVLSTWTTPPSEVTDA